MNLRISLAAAALLILSVGLGACGGGGSSQPSPPPPPSPPIPPPAPLVPAPTFAINVTVSGLKGSGLALRNNGGDTLLVAANGANAFATALTSGSAYVVTVFSQPVSPAQHCVVANGGGSIVTANITNVTVTCGNAAARFAYALNSADGTLTAYAVDSATGQLRLRGGYVKVGTTPVVSALDVSGKFVYVANNGSANVSAFAYNSTTGSLTEVSGSPFATGTQPTALAFHPNGKFI
jgi:6-phosphogluconolactonase